MSTRAIGVSDTGLFRLTPLAVPCDRRIIRNEHLEAVSACDSLEDSINGNQCTIKYTAEFAVHGAQEDAASERSSRLKSVREDVLDKFFCGAKIDSDAFLWKLGLRRPLCEDRNFIGRDHIAYVENDSFFGRR